VGPGRVVMLDALGKDCFEVTVAEDEHPVEALAPDSAHDPLADRVRSGCPDRALDDPGALCGLARHDDLGGEVRVTATD
jgi:hypothetical protein